jgi:cell division protease FtsH
MFEKNNKEKMSHNNNNKETKRNKELELFLKKKRKSNQNLNFILWIVTFFVVFLLIESFSTNNLFNPNQEKPVNEFLKNAKEGKILNVNVQGDIVRVKEVDGTEYIFKKEVGLSLDQILKNNEIPVSSIKGEVKVESVVPWGQVALTLLSIIIPLAFLYWIFGRSKGGASDVFSFGKSRAKLFFKGSQSITFNDVAGNKEAKTNLQEIVDFLKFPDKYRKLGARIPKGVLLVGQSGVGKTLLAKAIAGEANVPFFSVAGSEFMEMLVGVGSSRARDLFKMAREQQPSLIFIDEIDAIGRQRGMGIGGGHDEREQTLNQILIEMDGFDERTNVIVLAATNRPDMLDPALVRPGRFDRKINIPLPDFEDRKGIIQIHMRNKPFTDEVGIEDVSRKTVGFSGADIENMLNEAAILAARENRDKITPKDLDNASLKVTMGEERRTLMTEDEKKITAYHEAGHAVVAAMSKDMDPVYRISIIPRGGSLGHTSLPPEKDRHNETKTRLLSLIATMLGGRAAEELVFSEFTIGASSDIERATSLARKMVTEFGMSSLGPISFDGHHGSYFLAKELGEGPLYSEETSAKIDREIKGIIDNSYQQAILILKANKKILDEVSERLLERETIDSTEFNEILKKSL